MGSLAYCIDILKMNWTTYYHGDLSGTNKVAVKKSEFPIYQ